MEAIFSCLNRKPHHGFLPYSMTEVFTKTWDGLSVIIIS